jgi:hypothetical protein
MNLIFGFRRSEVTTATTCMMERGGRREGRRTGGG